VNLIFDLDGTLICAKERLFTLFSDLVPESKLTFEQYWDLKFSRLTNLDILNHKFGYSKSDQAAFESNWMASIEDESYLSMDKPIVGVFSYLDSIKCFHNLYLCTNRQFKDQLFEQLTRLDLLGFFIRVLVTEQKKSKIELIESEVENLSGVDWLIGDTGKDMQAGKALKLRTCAVLSGFMNRTSLIEYQPDLIVDDVTLLKIE